jgi:hypothetical protein
MLENFVEFNVSGACIAIIATLLGAGYPLFLNLLKDINTVYSSTLILTELKKEKSFIRFNIWLRASLIALFLWVCGIEPWHTTDLESLNFIINNSAEILLLVSTIVLVFNFFLFVKVSFKYYQPYETVTKLIRQYKESIEKE